MTNHETPATSPVEDVRVATIANFIEPSGNSTFGSMLADTIYDLDVKIFGPELALSKSYAREKVLRNQGNLCFTHLAPIKGTSFFDLRNFAGYSLISLGFQHDDYVVPDDTAFFVGTAVQPEYRRRGYANKQREDLLKFAFECWRVDRVLTTMRVNNEAMERSNKTFKAKIVRELGPDLYSDGEERVELEITREAWIEYARERRLEKPLGSDPERDEGRLVRVHHDLARTVRRYGDEP